MDYFKLAQKICYSGLVNVCRCCDKIISRSDILKESVCSDCMKDYLEQVADRWIKKEGEKRDE